MAKLLLLTFCVVLAAVVFDAAQAACTCTGTTSSCTVLKTYLDCLKSVTSCTADEQTAINSQRSIADTAWKTLGCSGAGNLMTSVGFVLVLTSLAYLFNGKKM